MHVQPIYVYSKYSEIPLKKGDSNDKFLHSDANLQHIHFDFLNCRSQPKIYRTNPQEHIG